MSKNIRIVISRYNEDLSWTDTLHYEKTIYNKGDNLELDHIQLPNIGREAHSYLYHIVNNYYSIDDWTIFLQGYPFDHCSNIIDIINRIPESLLLLKQCGPGCYYLSDKNLVETQKDVEHLRVYSQDLYDQLFITPKTTFEFSSGAQYLVHKNNILNKPVNFYSNILSNYNWNSHIPWSIERLWPDIFGNDSKIRLVEENP